jgi:hypothetical protein
VPFAVGAERIAHQRRPMRLRFILALRGRPLDALDTY